jgi:citronellyl-CoA synthetase
MEDIMISFLQRKYSRVHGLLGVATLKKGKAISVGAVLEKQASKRPGKPLILFEDRSISYREFNETANRYAHLFRSLDFRRGDTVALFMDNRPEYLIIHAGLAKIGVVPALVNNNIRGKVLAHALNIAGAKAIIVGHEFAAEYLAVANEVKLAKPGLAFIEKEGADIKTPKGLKDLAPLLAGQPVLNPAVDPPITTRDVLEYIYTSGTTGMPKATVLTHHKWVQLGYGAGGLCLTAIPGDVQYCCLPLYHNSGINIAWPTTLMHGGTFALRRKFSASNFWNDVRKYNATLFVYIGELCRYLNNQPKKDDDADNPLRYILGNGMRGDYWVEFQERFGIERIVEVYGATEGVGGLSNIKGVPGMIGRLRTAGIRMGEVARYDAEKEMLVRDERGFVEKCRPGETGMFLAKISDVSPFSGYKGNTKATSEKIIENVFRPGDRYFVSGDLFKLHEKDYVSFVDRLGDTFKWKGEVVATNEVADILNRFGGIEDSNVYGVAVKGAEGRCGMVALTPLAGASIDWKKFASYVNANLPVYARPYFVRVRREKDATSSFKQLKTALQKEGFDPKAVRDPLYFLDPRKKAYVKLTPGLYGEIQSGKIKF